MVVYPTIPFYFIAYLVDIQYFSHSQFVRLVQAPYVPQLRNLLINVAFFGLFVIYLYICGEKGLNILNKI